uniref:Uncharacterized protein n=1 Tax=Rhizophora mucronata TaxID=61149 RepID=A0A2P2MYD0_RHIMU
MVLMLESSHLNLMSKAPMLGLQVGVIIMAMTLKMTTTCLLMRNTMEISEWVTILTQTLGMKIILMEHQNLQGFLKEV